MAQIYQRWLKGCLYPCPRIASSAIRHKVRRMQQHPQSADVRDVRSCRLLRVPGRPCASSRPDLAPSRDHRNAGRPRLYLVLRGERLRQVTAWRSPRGSSPRPGPTQATIPSQVSSRRSIRHSLPLSSPRRRPGLPSGSMSTTAPSGHACYAILLDISAGGASFRAPP